MASFKCNWNWCPLSFDSSSLLKNHLEQEHLRVDKILQVKGGENGWKDWLRARTGQGNSNSFDFHIPSASTTTMPPSTPSRHGSAHNTISARTSFASYQASSSPAQTPPIPSIAPSPALSERVNGYTVIQSNPNSLLRSQFDLGSPIPSKWKGKERATSVDVDDDCKLTPKDPLSSSSSQSVELHLTQVSQEESVSVGSRSASPVDHRTPKKRKRKRRRSGREDEGGDEERPEKRIRQEDMATIGDTSKPSLRRSTRSRSKSVEPIINRVLKAAKHATKGKITLKQIQEERGSSIPELLPQGRVTRSHSKSLEPSSTTLPGKRKTKSTSPVLYDILEERETSLQPTLRPPTNTPTSNPESNLHHEMATTTNGKKRKRYKNNKSKVKHISPIYQTLSTSNVDSAVRTATTQALVYSLIHFPHEWNPPAPSSSSHAMNHIPNIVLPNSLSLIDDTELNTELEKIFRDENLVSFVRDNKWFGEALTRWPWLDDDSESSVRVEDDKESTVVRELQKRFPRLRTVLMRPEDEEAAVDEESPCARGQGLVDYDDEEGDLMSHTHGIGRILVPDSSQLKPHSRPSTDLHIPNTSSEAITSLVESEVSEESRSRNEPVEDGRKRVGSPGTIIYGKMLVPATASDDSNGSRYRSKNGKILVSATASDADVSSPKKQEAQFAATSKNAGDSEEKEFSAGKILVPATLSDANTSAKKSHHGTRTTPSKSGHSGLDVGTSTSPFFPKTKRNELSDHGHFLLSDHPFVSPSQSTSSSTQSYMKPRRTSNLGVVVVVSDDEDELSQQSPMSKTSIKSTRILHHTNGSTSAEIRNSGEDLQPMSLLDPSPAFQPSSTSQPPHQSNSASDFDLNITASLGEIYAANPQNSNLRDLIIGRPERHIRFMSPLPSPCRDQGQGQVQKHDFELPDTQPQGVEINGVVDAAIVDTELGDFDDGSFGSLKFQSQAPYISQSQTQSQIQDWDGLD
ncbi:hypothetical protein C8Q75DRAFT_774497 [Abortiporus biennis]|nr:hypothetical protein C8Q75DRAFT_774497 [Abortiporus biennis]